MPGRAETLNVTNITSNVTLINVTVTAPPSFYVTGYLENGTLHVYVSAGVVSGQPPPVQIIVGANGSVLATLQVTDRNFTCAGPVCRYETTVKVGNYSEVWMLVRSEGYEENITVKSPALGSGIGATIALILAFAIPATLAARSDPRKAGLGAIAGGVLVYVLGNYAGLVEARPIFYIMPIVVGALILFLGGG